MEMCITCVAPSLSCYLNTIHVYRYIMYYVVLCCVVWCVQDVMIRISNILDDMLVLDSVVRVIKRRFRPPGVPSPRCHPLASARMNTLAPSAVPPPPLGTPPLSAREKSFSFDSTSLLTPRALPAPLALDRVRMSPSPRHRNRKKLRKKSASFKDLSRNGGDPGDRINTIFETQEVMLHNACCLIRILVLDNAKVR